MEKTKAETTEIILKYAETFASLEDIAKEYADDMRELQNLKVKYNKIFKRMSDINNKWHHKNMTFDMEDFCHALIKEHGFDRKSLKNKKDFPSPFRG